MPSGIFRSFYTGCKRFGTDKIDSAVDFQMNYGGGRTGYMVFYKFQDDWWLLELSDTGDTPISYWILDSFDGIEQWSDTVLPELLNLV